MKISNFTQNSLLFSLIKGTDVIKNQIFKDLKSLGLNFNQALIIVILYSEKKKSIEPGDLVFALHSAKATISQSLTKLEELSMIERSINQDDARRNEILLTTKGRKTALKAISIIDSFDKNLEREISKKDLKAFLQFLNSFTNQ